MAGYTAVTRRKSINDESIIIITIEFDLSDVRKIEVIMII